VNGRVYVRRNSWSGRWWVFFEGAALGAFSTREEAMTYANQRASDIYTARLLKELRGES
jgi:hypothetical protein